MNRKSLMIFPIFEECREWTLDPYWMKIFSECADGKFPNGMKMGKNSIILTKTSKEFPFSNDPLENFKMIMKIFKIELKLGESVPTKSYNCEYYDWKDIKTKKIKHLLILKYVVQCAQTYSLDLHSSKKLMSVINLSFILKQIKGEHITLEEGRIKKIEGLSFQRGRFECSFKKVEEKSSEQNSIDKISQALDRYIKDYKNSLVI